VTDIVLR